MRTEYRSSGAST